MSTQILADRPSTVNLNPSPPCGTCEGQGSYQSRYSGRTVRCGQCATDPFEETQLAPDRICRKSNCRMEFHSSDLRKGRLGNTWEHPHHSYAPCGHDVTFWGMDYTRSGAESALYGLVHTLDETQLLQMRDSDPFPGHLPGLMEAFYAVLCSYDEQGTRTRLYRWICDALAGLDAGMEDATLPTSFHAPLPAGWAREAMAVAAQSEMSRLEADAREDLEAEFAGAGGEA